MQERRMKLRGLETAWLEGGRDDAPAIIVFLHGYPDGPEVWERQFDEFSHDYKLVAPFVRGVGASAKPQHLSRYAPTAVALDTLEILREIDPKEERLVYCIGHDLGTVHAYELARLLQSRAAGLVLVNGLSIAQMARRLTNPRQLVKSWYMFFMQLPLLPEAVGTVFAPLVRRGAFRAGGRPAAEAGTAAESRAALVGPHNQYRAFFRCLPAALGERSPKIGCPLLVLWGSHDAFLVPPTTDEFELIAKDTALRILEGNHWLQRERAAEVNGVLRGFFVGRSTRASRPQRLKEENDVAGV